jgi:hypothetical protein
VLRLRREYGFAEGDFARATGASVATVRRWTSARPAGRSRYDDALRDLAAIVALLSQELEPPYVLDWLLGRSKALDWQHPLDTLREPEGFERVKAAAEDFLYGEYS